MYYGNIPVIIPILATGYLFAVYLLLGLAQRHTKDSDSSSVLSNSKTLQSKEAPVTGKVS